MMSKQNNKGRFTPGVSGNPKGRPKGGYNEAKKKILEAAPELIEQLIKEAGEGDPEARRLFFSLLPRPKSLIDPVKVPGLEEKERILDKVLHLVDRTGKGEISPTVAETLTRVLTAVKEKEEMNQTPTVLVIEKSIDVT